MTKTIWRVPGSFDTKSLKINLLKSQVEKNWTCETYTTGAPDVYVSTPSLAVTGFFVVFVVLWFLKRNFQWILG